MRLVTTLFLKTVKQYGASIKPLKQINKQINKMKKERPGEYTIEKIEGWLTK